MKIEEKYDVTVKILFMLQKSYNFGMYNPVSNHLLRKIL